MKRNRYVAALSVLILAVCSFGCGGGNKASSRITVTTTPATATVLPGGNQTFLATVSGTTNRSVSWSLQEGVAAGAITPAGVYTAPASAGTYHAVATSMADLSRRGSSTITVPVVVVVNPAAVTIAKAAKTTITATVTGATNTSVTWTLREGAPAGTITQAGLYTAPGVAGMYHVIATSNADTTKSATATVTVP